MAAALLHDVLDDTHTTAAELEARFSDEYLEKVVKAGGKAFFLKPIAAHEMVDTLDELTIQREPDPFRVLIVDDDPVIADTLSYVLSEDFTVTTAESRPHAKALLRQGDPREILTRLRDERRPAYAEAPIHVTSGRGPQARTVATSASGVWIAATGRFAQDPISPEG